MLLVVQFTMVFHARHVALAAAQSGARVARTAPAGGGWEEAASAKAAGDVREIGPELLSDLSVRAGESGDERWVKVSGYAVTVVPFMKFQCRSGPGGRSSASAPTSATASRANRGPRDEGAGDGDRGSMSLEMVLVTPLFVAFLLFLAGAGRMVDAKSQVDGAARDAVRSASIARSAPAAQRLAAETAAAGMAGPAGAPADPACRPTCPTGGPAAGSA